MTEQDNAIQELQTEVEDKERGYSTDICLSANSAKTLLRLLASDDYVSVKDLRVIIKHEDETCEDDGNTQYYLGYTAGLEWVLSQLTQKEEK